MRKARVLFISSEIHPYLDLSEQSEIARNLPQGIQERGKEIRTFMPRFGNINERRNQLHEVIRLSGMNLIIDDTDHPLIIKVASIQAARMQVYFIDNEEYFQRKCTIRDTDETFFADNDDRTIFFGRGVLETVKKLGWSPDIIHCHGWMTALIPLLIKTSYKDDPMFHNSKVVYSLYNDSFTESFNKDFGKKILMDGLSSEDVKGLEDPNYVNLTKLAMHYSDAVMKSSTTLHDEIESTFKSLSKPTLDYKSPEEYIEAYDNFYDEAMLEDSVLAE
ncbi:MAG: glycogen/starch synthase [Bacteroidia bacterium]|jgi:starch synthase|nr:glycogen/starch synthase [Bacteroidia bacterium]MBP7245418.1 glycogen/starch synthase [Bacteroidia bacterium]